MSTGGIIVAVITVFAIAWLALGWLIMPKDKTDGWGMYLFFLLVYPVFLLALCIAGGAGPDTAEWD